MKNLIYLFLLTPICLEAQLKVHSTGNVSLGGETTPRATLDINKNTPYATTSQFGTFGIQSFAAGNGFLLGNGFWNGTAIEAYENGSVNLIQFNNNMVRIRTTPVLSSGGTTTDLQNNISAIHGGGLGAIVGINTMSPSGYNLYVQGTAFKSDGNSSWSVVSDRRLKKNIVEFNQGLEIVNKINVVEYEYNGKAGTKEGEKHIGIIAQEIQEIAPFMVSESELIESTNATENDEIKDYLTFNDSSLPFILVNAIKEQQKQINDLKDVNNKLRLKIEYILKYIEKNNLNNSGEYFSQKD